MGQHQKNVIEAAKQAGVKHLVKLSVMGAEIEPTENPLGKLHREGEKLLEASGMQWTHVRPGVFMSNWLNHGGTVKRDGAMYAPAGAGKFAPVHPADIAEVVVAALTQDGHAGKAYVVTGAESLSYQQQADVLGKVIGKAVKHVDVPPDAAQKAMIENKMPEWMAKALVGMSGAIKAGYLDRTSPHFKQVTGHEQRTIETWFKENAAAFK
jgi:uncharacterized protein YbjT (DUF2867 family)